jgi:hypothetical protein
MGLELIDVAIILSPASLRWISIFHFKRHSGNLAECDKCLESVGPDPSLALFIPHSDGDAFAFGDVWRVTTVFMASAPAASPQAQQLPFLA